MRNVIPGLWLAEHPHGVFEFALEEIRLSLQMLKCFFHEAEVCSNAKMHYINCQVATVAKHQSLLLAGIGAHIGHESVTATFNPA